MSSASGDGSDDSSTETTQESVLTRNMIIINQPPLHDSFVLLSDTSRLSQIKAFFDNKGGTQGYQWALPYCGCPQIQALWESFKYCLTGSCNAMLFINTVKCHSAPQLRSQMAQIAVNASTPTAQHYPSYHLSSNQQITQLLMPFYISLG
jgi:hypothetical protein